MKEILRGCVRLQNVPKNHLILTQPLKTVVKGTTWLQVDM